MSEEINWGSSPEQISRNKRQYEQYLSCGYNEPPVFDDYGWVKNEVPKDKAERINLFGEEPVVSYVECLQLPNGKWVTGSHWMLSESGFAGGCSIWSKQYNSRISALTAAMRAIADKIKESNKQVDKAYLADVVRAIDDIRQLSLF